MHRECGFAQKLNDQWPHELDRKVFFLFKLSHTNEFKAAPFAETTNSIEFRTFSTVLGSF